MSYKPILFNTEMVKAIQVGRKTQTRRLIKDFAGEEITSILKPDGSYGKYGTKGWRGMLPDRGDGNEYCIEVRPPCEPGDILWVRETWCDPEPDNYMVPVFYKADMPMHWDAEDTALGEAVCITEDEFKWRPSIHIPKDFARIFLRVKDVRVEQLRNGFFKEGTAILEVQKEGVDIGETCRTCLENYGCPCCIDSDGDIDECRDPECGELDNPRDVFARLWDSTIKPAERYEYGWAANPWVWVIEFERCERQADFL